MAPAWLSDVCFPNADSAYCARVAGKPEVGLDRAHYRHMARRPQGDEAETTFPNKHKHLQTHLRLPDIDYSKKAVLNSLTSVDGQRGHGHAIDEFAVLVGRSIDARKEIEVLTNRQIFIQRGLLRHVNNAPAAG
jgi:hypothetical protein